MPPTAPNPATDGFSAQLAVRASTMHSHQSFSHVGSTAAEHAWQTDAAAGGQQACAADLRADML